MTKEENDKSCRAIQNYGEQHPLFHKPFMARWRNAGKKKASK